MGERTSEYWQERFRQLEESQHDTSVQTVQKIEQEFRRAEQALDGKINAWYQRFAANNGISMVEARRLLNSDELEEFQWDVQDYIKYGRENGINQQWEKQLENASAKVHISRLEALKVQTQQEIEKLYGNYRDSIDDHIASVYMSGYYHTAYEVQRGVGVGWQMQSFNSEKVGDIIHKPWAVDGRNFSDRIWTDKTKLINNMHDSLTRMCITGESPDRAIREISQNMKVSRSQAARIVQTESAAFSAKAQETCFFDLEVEEFEVVETLDGHTCPTCGEMDGKHFPMKDYKIGVTVPPFHPNCRGCTCPYFNDEFTTGERVARGADGKKYYVPENMTYEEWHASYANGDTKSGKSSSAPHTKPSEQETGAEERLISKGIQVNIEGAETYHEEVSEALKHLDKLTDEYKNTVVSYSVSKGNLTASAQEAGAAYMLNGKTAISVKPSSFKIRKATDALNLGEMQPYGITYHEFAHSLSQSREKVNPEFWREIRKIKKEYEGMRGKSDWFDIKISDYASKDVDEFLAEAFTQAKLSKSPSPYATETLKVVDKYFKKNSVENLAESSKIKSDLQFFAKKHKPKKVPDDDPLWDSLVKGDVEKQMEDGIFEWEHGGYDYLIEIKDRYTYDILSRKKKPNIHE